MTIAAGFRCADGILLCADSQYSNFEETFRDKVFLRTEIAETHIGFVFSGDEGYAKTAIQDCVDGVNELPHGGRSALEVRKAIRRAIKRVIKDYESEAVDPSQKPEFLIAIRFEGQLQLWSARDTAFLAAENVNCLGSGMYVAQHMLSRISHPEFMKITQVLPQAMRALASAKERDPNCGGGSQFLVMRPGMSTAIKSLKPDELDGMVHNFDTLTRDLFGSITEPITNAEFAERLNYFCTGVADLRNGLIADGSKYQAFLAALSDLP